MTTISIENLAEQLGGNLWIKGDLKRIYLNEAGYNTKKMSTKVYVYEKNGEFRVSVNIDCPSQHSNWIEAQENELTERIERKIEEILNEGVFEFTKETELDVITKIVDLGLDNEVTKTLNEDGSGKFELTKNILKKEAEKINSDSFKIEDSILFIYNDNSWMPITSVKFDSTFDVTHRIKNTLFTFSLNKDDFGGYSLESMISNYVEIERLS